MLRCDRCWIWGERWGLGPASGVVHFIVEGRLVLEEKVVGGSLGLLREAFGSCGASRLDFTFACLWEASSGVRAS
jgi:hypothetical protein